MNSYLILIFFHVSGAVGMFAAWGMEATTLSWLRRSLTVREARVFTKRLKKQGPLAPSAMIVTLGTGIWMMALRWGHQYWMSGTVIALVLIMVTGVVMSRRLMPRIDTFFAGKPEQLSTDFRTWITALAVSLRMRISIGLGIVGLMTIKPALTGAAVIMAIALSIGIITSFYSFRQRK